MAIVRDAADPEPAPGQVRMADQSGHIDVHHHVIPPLYRDALTVAGVIDPIPGVDYPTWSLVQTLELMDRHRIQAAILSVTDPGVGFVNGTERARLARSLNEYFAELISERPDRFGAFAVLPLPDTRAALEELAHAIDVLGLDGIGLLTNHDGIYPGDEELAPVLAEAAARDLPVFVHPATPPELGRSFDLPVSLYEFTFETTRMVANLLYSGTLDRHPDLRLILCHAGGAVPYLAHRLTHGPTISSALAERAPTDVIGALQRLYYDTAMSASPYSFGSLRTLVEAGRILFGTDYPFMPEQTTVETLSGIERYGGFDEDEEVAVLRRNALGLFPRLRKIFSQSAEARPTPEDSIQPAAEDAGIDLAAQPDRSGG
jgi:6-methylsalicylate decarboxylase